MADAGITTRRQHFSLSQQIFFFCFLLFPLGLISFPRLRRPHHVVPCRPFVRRGSSRPRLAGVTSTLQMDPCSLTGLDPCPRPGRAPNYLSRLGRRCNEGKRGTTWEGDLPTALHRVSAVAESRRSRSKLREDASESHRPPSEPHAIRRRSFPYQRGAGGLTLPKIP